MDLFLLALGVKVEGITGVKVETGIPGGFLSTDTKVLQTCCRLACYLV
jgi:hypothetical protein